MLTFTMLSVFIGLWFGTVTMARMIHRTSIPAGNFIILSLSATFLIWRFFLRG